MTMSYSSPKIKIECVQTTAIIRPMIAFDDFNVSELENEIEDIMETMEVTPEIRHVIVDLRQTNHFGSLVLAFLVRLWRRASLHEGEMVLCHASEHENQILQITHLDRLWKSSETLDEAFSVIEPAC